MGKETLKPMNTIKFENKEYSWEDIPGKGKCLVPVSERPVVSSGDIYKGRRFKNSKGDIKEIRFVYYYEKANPNIVCVGYFLSAPESSDSLSTLMDTQEMANYLNCRKDLFQEWVEKTTKKRS